MRYAYVHVFRWRFYRSLTFLFMQRVPITQSNMPILEWISTCKTGVDP